MNSRIIDKGQGQLIKRIRSFNNVDMQYVSSSCLDPSIPHLFYDWHGFKWAHEAVLTINAHGWFSLESNPYIFISYMELLSMNYMVLLKDSPVNLRVCWKPWHLGVIITIKKKKKSVIIEPCLINLETAKRVLF